MTQVLFAFKHPDGTPLVDATFTVRLQRSGFIFEQDGVVVPETFTYTTGPDGTALATLQPSSSPYLLVVVETGQDDDDDECCSTAGGAIRYKFYVPDSQAVVRAQDLLLAPVPNKEPWDEEAIQMLTDAKIAALDAAARAETAVNRAEELAIDFNAIELRINVMTERAETAADKSEAHEANSFLARDSAEAFAVDALTSVGKTQLDKLDAQQSAMLASDVAAAALLTSNIYDSVTLGLASGKPFFNVPSADTAGFLTLYKNVAGAAQELETYPSTKKVEALDTYVHDLLRLDSVEGIAIAMTDALGNRSWLEAEDEMGGPSQLALTHIKRTTGVSMIDDAEGYLMVVADSNGVISDLCVRDTDGQVPDFVMSRWAARLSDMGIGGDSYTKSAHNNAANMRKTRMKFGQLESGDANTQLSIGFIGDSYTAGQPYYLRELTKRLSASHGFAGPGFIGFNHGGALGDSNFLYNDSNPAYFGGSWTKSALGQASPDNRTITAGAVGDYVGIQSVEAPTISTLLTSAKLMYLGNGTDPTVRYRWADTDAWNTLTLTGTGAQQIDFTVLPVGINWKFRLEVVTGLPTLFGVYAKNSANGIICSKMAASGSATGDWYKPSDAAWMTQWKASVSMIPVDTYMLMLGGNDQGAGVAPATYLANIQGMYAVLKEINPAADVHITIRQDTARTNTYPMSAYADLVRKWAWGLKIPCSDMQYAFGTNPADYASDGILPLIDTDKTHPISTTGGRLITEFFYRLLHTAQ